MTKNKQTYQSPGQLVLKRLKRDKVALAGLAFIVLAILTSVFGYVIVPDNSESANDGAIEIRKKSPGFSVQLIKIKSKREQTNKGFFSRMFTGKELDYSTRPIESYVLHESTVEVAIYGGNGTIKEMYNYKDLGVTKATFEKEVLIQNTYLLGTDALGRDLFSRLVLGTRISLMVGFIAVFISLVVGVTLGIVAGYFGGWIDKIIVWFLTVVWSIPGIMLVIAISIAIQSKGAWVAFVAVGLTMWVEVARVVRGQLLEVREMQYVEAAKVLGVSDVKIMFKHILPNLLGPIIVVATSNFASAILVEAGLSFLGMGVQPPTPSWGLMVHEGFKLVNGLETMHLILFPGIAISLLVFAFNLFGNGLRDAFDPKNN